MSKNNLPHLFFIFRNSSGNGVETALHNYLISLKSINFLTPIIITDKKYSFLSKYSFKVIILPNFFTLDFDYFFSLIYLSIYSNRKDILFYFKNTIPLNHFILSSKKMVLIHDLGFLHFNFYSFLDTIFQRFHFLFTKFLANFILFPTLSIKKEFLAKYPQFYNKTKHLHYFVDRSIRKPLFSSYQFQNYFFAPLSSLSPRKEIPYILHLFQKLKEKDATLKLIITGWRVWGISKEILSQIKKEKDIIWLKKRVSKEDLNYLYSNCKAIFYLSKYEGFGLPIIEGLSHKKLVIINSKCFSSVEVGGNFVLSLDCYDIEEDSQKILEKINSKDYEVKIQSHLQKFSRKIFQKEFQIILSNLTK